MKIAIICVGVVTLRFRTVPPHGSSNKTRVNRAMPYHRMSCIVKPNEASPMCRNVTHIRTHINKWDVNTIIYFDKSASEFSNILNN